MNKDNLFNYLSEQKKEVILDLLNKSYVEMSIDQQNNVFGVINKKVPLKNINDIELLDDIDVFCQLSSSGYYYRPFNINSKNYSHIPEETNEWFESLADFLKNSSQLTAQEDHITAVKCFKKLYDLIEKMEDGEDIIFADEYGSWMIPTNEKPLLISFFTSLSKVKNAIEFSEIAIPIIIRDSYMSYVNDVYSLVINISNKEQGELLKKEIKDKEIKVK